MRARSLFAANLHLVYDYYQPALPYYANINIQLTELVSEKMEFGPSEFRHYQLHKSSALSKSDRTKTGLFRHINANENPYNTSYKQTLLFMAGKGYSLTTSVSIRLFPGLGDDILAPFSLV